jgi:hypothetical protein
MNKHEVKAINEAIALIGRFNRNPTWGCNYNALDDAALRLQFIMDCSKSLDARELADTIVSAFDLWDRIEALRAEAAA